jgi:hypothetical protein
MRLSNEDKLHHFASSLPLLFFILFLASSYFVAHCAVVVVLAAIDFVI